MISADGQSVVLLVLLKDQVSEIILHVKCCITSVFYFMFH